jgi:hypothetical protein
LNSIETEYNCNTPIAIIIFNRVNETKILLNSLKIIKPKIILIISDGPRESVIDDYFNVNNCRALVDQIITWECNITKIYSDINLGCLRRIVTGIDQVFKLHDKCIFLEDDCIPTLSFFKFMEWGLNYYKNNNQVGMISGSNLISDKYPIKSVNGFSQFINIWGWATWKHMWLKHNSYVTINEINSNIFKILQNKNYQYWQIIFWKELLKFTIYKGSTWDFQLQYTFFKNNLLSVYPKYNLINNIGFGENSTHTKCITPKYVLSNDANKTISLNYLNIDSSLNISKKRDFLLAKTIWNFNIFSTIKLFVKNLFRFI